MKTILEREDTPLYRMADQLDMLVAEAAERRHQKALTQAELMQVMRVAIDHVEEVEEPAEPPSLTRLIIELRKPEVRRGLHRLVMLLESLGTGDTEVPHRKEAPE